MEQIKGPVINEVLERAADQEHPKHEASGREIRLLWKRVVDLADTGATESQVFQARKVAAQRDLELKQRLDHHAGLMKSYVRREDSRERELEQLNQRLEDALDAAQHYRIALEERLAALEETPEEPLPMLSAWGHFRDWG